MLTPNYSFKLMALRCIGLVQAMDRGRTGCAVS